MICTIENEVLRASVTTSGAQLCSVIRKDDGVEHIWCGDPSVWGYHAPILFPHCGALPDDSFEARGKLYRSARHGSARDMEHALVEACRDRVSLELASSAETLERSPYRYRLVSTFSLEGDAVIHRLSVENCDVERMPFGIGYHPAFAIPFDDGHSACGYELRFSDLESPICLATGQNGLLSGRTYLLAANVRSIPIDDSLFANGSHCMIGLRSRTIGLHERDSSRAVVCDISNFPYTVIWSPPGTPRLICIEPWHSLPAAEGAPKKWDEIPAAAIIDPGETWETELKISFVR